MHLEYDPVLIEQSVDHAARQDVQLENDLHDQIDSLYAVSDQRERERRFRGAYREFFQRWGFDALIPRLLSERSIILEGIARCLVRAAPRRRDEIAELYEKSGSNGADNLCTKRTLTIGVCPGSMVEPDDFIARMRGELLHVADMLDEDFGYERQALVGRQPRQNLIRDRYRVLWDIYAEGRLAGKAGVDSRCAVRLNRQFERVFPGQTADDRQGAFERLYGAEALTHAELLQWATDPPLLFNNGRKVSQAREAFGTGGEACPICGFTTFDWLTPSGLSEQTKVAIRGNHPQWEPAQGICRRCAEIYSGV